MTTKDSLEIEIKGVTGSGKTLLGAIIARELRKLGYKVTAPDLEHDNHMLPKGWDNTVTLGQRVTIKEKNVPREAPTRGLKRDKYPSDLS